MCHIFSFQKDKAAPSYERVGETALFADFRQLTWSLSWLNDAFKFLVFGSHGRLGALEGEYSHQARIRREEASKLLILPPKMSKAYSPRELLFYFT